jgi:phage gpG-like protein
MYDIEFEDNGVTLSLKRIQKDMPHIVKKLLGAWSDEIIKISENEYLDAAPGNTQRLHSRSGDLSSALYAKITGDYAILGNPMVYAAIHENGGTITARNSEYLHFKTRDGSWVKTRQVTIPKRPFLKPAIDEVVKTAKAKRVADVVLKRELQRRWK